MEKFKSIRLVRSVTGNEQPKVEDGRLLVYTLPGENLFQAMRRIGWKVQYDIPNKN